ncbi:MAG: hypothetical protein AAGI24_04100 [Pseudomonadota bacterium]
MNQNQLPATTRIAAILQSDGALQLTANEAASMACMSAPSMRRKLRREGTSWQELYDQAWIQRVHSINNKRMEGGGLALPGKSIAHLVGYSVNAFYRCYYRITGELYRTYRRRMRAEMENMQGLEFMDEQIRERRQLAA